LDKQKIQRIQSGIAFESSFYFFLVLTLWSQRKIESQYINFVCVHQMNIIDVCFFMFIVLKVYKLVFNQALC